MNRNWNNKTIIKNIKDNGYYIFKNFFNEKSLNEIKNSLWETLNYIKKDNEKNLISKYYKIKKFNKKLKGNWYDMACHNLTLYKFLHSEKMIKLIKEYFKTKVVFYSRPCINVHYSSKDFLL